MPTVKSKTKPAEIPWTTQTRGIPDSLQSGKSDMGRVNAMPVTSLQQSVVTSQLDFGLGQSALAPRTHRWEEFKKRLWKRRCGPNLPTWSDSWTGGSRSNVTSPSSRLSLLKSAMTTHFKSGPAFGLSAEIKSKVGVCFDWQLSTMRGQHARCWS